MFPAAICTFFHQFSSSGADCKVCTSVTRVRNARAETGTASPICRGETHPARLADRHTVNPVRRMKTATLNGGLMPDSSPSRPSGTRRCRQSEQQSHTHAQTPLKSSFSLQQSLLEARRRSNDSHNHPEAGRLNITFTPPHRLLHTLLYCLHER